MTDSIIPSPRPFATTAANDKTRAFRAATRHSSRVRLLRRSIFAGALVLVVGVLVFSIVDPFRKVVQGVSIDSIGVDGTKVTMARPRLSGYRSDGRPYEIFAASAVQDIKAPTKFELHEMDAHLTMQDKTVTHVTALLGTYDSAHDLMDLNSEVHITSDSGLNVVTKDAHVEFKSGSLVTRNPVTVAMRGSTIAADGMRMIDGGKQITFEGHVQTMFQPGEAHAAADKGQVPAP